MNNVTIERANIRRIMILAYIAKHVKEEGIPPTVREIGKGVGLRSTSTVQAHILWLERAGVISRKPGKERMIRLEKETLRSLLQADPTGPLPWDREREREKEVLFETMWNVLCGRISERALADFSGNSCGQDVICLQ